MTDQAAYKIFFVDEAIRAVTDGVQGSCVDVLLAFLVCVTEIRRRCAFAVHAE